MSKKNKPNMASQKEELTNEEQKETIETASEQAPCPEEEAAEAPQPEESNEEKLAKALKEAEEKLAEMQQKSLYQMAEFDNYRKRTMKEKSEIILTASASLMTAVLPVLDDMDRALESMEKTNDAEACCEGFKLIAAKLRDTLEKNGLKKMEAVGEVFDADYHEAIAIVPAPTEEQKGRIIDCIQQGYKMNDKVLRHPKVVVGQ